MAEQSFASAAASGLRVISLEGGPPVPSRTCEGCGVDVAPPRSFAPLTADGTTAAADLLYCDLCRAAQLGPPCAGCGTPTSRADGLIALDAHWHAECLRCAHEECAGAAPLGLEYFEHDGAPYCRRHYLELAGERCAGCDQVVDGGLRALGRAWHEGCLRCGVSGEALEPGACFLHEGRPLAPAAKLRTAPRCRACGEAAISKRVYAHGSVYHHACFRCVHCRALIEERKFVFFDDEPYLDGCFQKLFGTAAGEATRALVHGEKARYAVHVPLLISLGPAGLANFAAKHAALFPAVRRVMREHGIVAAQTFVFVPPAVSKPSFFMALEIPTLLDAPDALPLLLKSDRAGVAWDQLITSAHDAPASKNNPWWSTLTPDAVAAESGEAASEVAKEDAAHTQAALGE